MIDGITAFAGNAFVQENVIGLGGLTIQRNRVAQNLQVFKNTGVGPKRVQLNTVLGNLQCFENLGFVGGPNFAQRAEGQCF